MSADSLVRVFFTTTSNSRGQGCPRSFPPFLESALPLNENETDLYLHSCGGSAGSAQRARGGGVQSQSGYGCLAGLLGHAEHAPQHYGKMARDQREVLGAVLLEPYRPAPDGAHAIARAGVGRSHPAV